MNRRFNPCHCLTAAALLLLCSQTFAQPVPVQHIQGAVHGFLLIRSESGAILGHADFSQLLTGDHLTIHTVLKFRDGSVDDETAVYIQRNNFEFVSDHHTQRGHFFKEPIDATLEANGQFTLRTTDKDGREKVETNHIELPDNICNGFLGGMLGNISPHAGTTTLSMVFPAGKGRLVKLIVTPAGTESFSAVTGDRRSASVFHIHIDLGGVAGVIAPILGKQPHDVTAWIYEEGAPVMVRETGQISEGGPILSIELGGTTFPRTTPAK